MRSSWLLGCLQLVAASSVSVQGISRLFDESVDNELSQSPFEVQIQASETSGNIKTVLTNKGSKDAYFAISVLQPAKAVQLYDTSDAPVQVIPVQSPHIQESIPFQKLVSGESMTLDIDIASNYVLSAGEQYYVQVGGFIPYYFEGQSRAASMNQNAIFEADIFPFQAPDDLPQTVVRAQQAILAPAITVTKCNDATMQQKMTGGIQSAIKQSKKAIVYVETGKDRTTMKNFFKNDDDKTRKIVADRLKAVVKALETSTGPGVLECQNTANAKAKTANSYCAKSKAMALTESVSGRVTMCNTSKNFPVDFKRCDDGNWGGTIVHELTHSNIVYKPNTVDVAYRLGQVKALSAAKALLNAQSYNFLLDSVSLGKSC